jgi:hypothetical protein
MPPKVKGKFAKRTFVRTGLLLQGIIIGMGLAGWSHQEISDEVTKSDGTHPSKATVGDIIRAHGAGETVGDMSDAGRPRETTAAQDKSIVRLVFKHRGRAIVTSKFIRKKIRSLRKISERTIRRRLEEAGLAWLRRRKKTFVPTMYKPGRLRWARWVLRQSAKALRFMIHTDGTSFYLARTLSEQENKARLALGAMVWKAADGHDGLCEDVLGPSSYAKGQGARVRLWGLLVGGVLFVYFLPQGEPMDRLKYEWIIRHKFEGWISQVWGASKVAATSLIQDHERCLWKTEPLNALRDLGITLRRNYPKASQDMNPIEICWRELRARLDVTMPVGRETRDEFVARARNAVAWCNRNRRKLFLEISRSTRDWAQELKDADGARLKH